MKPLPKEFLITSEEMLKGLNGCSIEIIKDIEVYEEINKELNFILMDVNLSQTDEIPPITLNMN